jgi:hypothetical protein
MPILINLNTDRGLDPTIHKTMMVKEDVRTSNILTAKARYPNAYRRLTEKEGWTDADGKFMRLTVFSAEALEAVWSGHDYFPWTNPCNSRNIIRAYGDYKVNYPVPKHMGRWEGYGPHTGWFKDFGALALSPYREQWLGSYMGEVAAMISTGYGQDSQMGGWVHGGYVGEIGFYGSNPGWYNPTMGEEHGLILWDEGEASTVGALWCQDFNGYGIKHVRGTPANYTRTISLFTNALGGIAIVGSELASINFGTISGDDNPALIVMKAGYGRGPGGMINISNIKCESGKRAPNKDMIAIWQQDACVGGINIGAVQSDQNFRTSHAAFVMKSREWGQTLNVGSHVGWNHRALVHDVTNGKHWLNPSYHPMVFTWASRNGGTLTDHVDNVQVAGTPIVAADRLGGISGTQEFNYTLGTPVYSITGGVVPTPAPTPTPGPTPTPTPAPTTNIPRTGWVFTPYAGAGATNVLDSSDTTYWQGTGPLAVGQTGEVDMKTSRSLTGVSFKCPSGFPNDFPAQYDIERWNGTAWVTVKAGNIGSANASCTFPAVTTTQFRIRVSKVNYAGGPWWTVAEITASGS